jgi:chromate transport protein ChrA
MWRLFNTLKWLWMAVVLAVAVNIASSSLFGPFLPGVHAFLQTNLWWELPLILIMVALTLGAALSQKGKRRREEKQKIWQQREQQQRKRAERREFLCQQFALLKDARELQPEDFRFQVLSPGESSSRVHFD